MTVYTIYETPDDMPATPFVVREFTIGGTGNGGARPGPLIGWANSLDSARLLIPDSHTVCITRSPDDVGAVVETWM